MIEEKYDINWPLTSWNLIIWTLFMGLGYYTLIKFIPYLATLEEPLKLFGSIFTLYASTRWFMWCGFPDIEYHNYRTIKRRKK